MHIILKQKEGGHSHSGDISAVAIHLTISLSNDEIVISLSLLFPLHFSAVYALIRIHTGMRTQ